tara:strand:+ start:15 stop:674 length:660 start_codon:yes stop_codon:yes gene_type:complete
MAITEITTKSIKDGEVVNADVNASAAIAGTKISPDFGSQNIVTTGSVIGVGVQVTSGDLIIPDKIVHTGDIDTTIRFPSADTFTVETAGSERFRVDSSGIDVTGAITATTTISDGKGDVRSIPSNAQSGAYVAVAADAGKVIYISTGGVTVNPSVFSAGDAITIINNSGSGQAITQGTSMTLYNTSDGTSGSKTLGARGMATIWFAANNISYISGGGLS